MNLLKKTNVYKYLVFNYMKYFAILVFSTYILYLIKEVVIFNIFIKYNDTLKKFILYLSYDTPYVILIILSLCSSLSFLLLFYKCLRVRYFKFISLIGYSPYSILFRLFIIIQIINIFLFPVYNSVGKELKKTAEIIYQDDVIKNINLKPYYHIKFKKVVNLNENNMLIFNNIILDPLDKDNPVINNVFVWNKKSNYYILSKKAIIENSKIKMEKSYKYNMFNNATSESNKLNLINNLSIRLTDSIDIKKIKTVSHSSLSIGEILNLIKINKSLSLRNPDYVLYFIFNLFPFFIAPLLAFLLCIFLFRYYKFSGYAVK